MASIDNAKTILIIGATSGIGRALAEALAALPSKPVVIAAGRRVDRLAELKVKGLETVQMDVIAPLDELKQNVEGIIAKYPELDAVIISSGVQYQHFFTKGVNLAEIHKEIAVNYLAVVNLITFFLPHFLKLSETSRPSWLIPISSGLALKPGTTVPNYSASKAAVHSLTNCLRAQLKDTSVNVLEIIPPLVESELHDEQGTTPALSKFWMPLDVYTTEAVKGLRAGTSHISAGKAAETWELFKPFDGPLGA
ncbi:hypothetical protein MKEN_00774200 [Mycena kentingensis (nom. inval.)]|nr:hypothetical protein MKEN_00774200 [Mycena kentingensis (nom. inval.)]